MYRMDFSFEFFIHNVSCFMYFTLLPVYTYMHTHIYYHTLYSSYKVTFSFFLKLADVDAGVNFLTVIRTAEMPLSTVKNQKY